MQDGILSRRERKRLNQKEEYISATYMLFREKGFENTSVEDISEAVDMGVGSLYYYFSSKEDLLANILLKAVRDLEKKFEKAYDEGVSLRESAGICAKLYLDFHKEYGSYLDIVNTVRQGHKKAVIDGETMESIYRGLWGCVETLKKIFEKHGLDGRWENIDMEEVAVISWAFTIGVGKFKKELLTTYPHLNFERIVNAALDLVFGSDALKR